MTSPDYAPLYSIGVRRSTGLVPTVPAPCQPSDQTLFPCPQAVHGDTRSPGSSCRRSRMYAHYGGYELNLQGTSPQPPTPTGVGDGIVILAQAVEMCAHYGGYGLNLQETSPQCPTSSPATAR